MRPTLTLLSLTISLACWAGADDFPQWRGPDRDGQVGGPAWPQRLDDASFRPVWKSSLGPSYSGPIIAGDRIFTTETRSEAVEVVHAYDRATGRELWVQEWPGAMSVPFFARSNGSWIRSTPAWDGESLYVAGMRDVLVCLDGKDGTIRWRRDFVAEDGTDVPTFGFVCSPLVDGDSVYVQAGGAFARLDRVTGKVIWRTLQDGGGMNGSAFSSPTFATIAGTRQLLVQTRTDLAGVAPEDGKVLWKLPIESFRGMNILTPLALDEHHIFTSAYGGKTQVVRVDKGDDGFAAGTAWTYKAQGYMSSPVRIGEQVYLHLRNQRVLCIDAATGKERWTEGKSFGKYWSVLAQGDRILGLDEKGILYLVQADPSGLRILDQRAVGKDTWAHVAVAGKTVAIRELDALAVYEWSTPDATR